MAEARRVERELILLAENKIREKIIPTWKKLVEDWAIDASNRGLTPKTIDNYLYNLKAYTFHLWANKLCDTITTTEIKNVIVIDLASKSEHQKQAVLKFIRCVFAYGLEAGHILRNPCPNLKFRIGDKLKKVLSKSQVEMLLNQAKLMNCEWYPHWSAAIYTGARNGELYALTWDKISFEEKTIFDKLLVEQKKWIKINEVRR